MTFRCPLVMAQLVHHRVDGLLVVVEVVDGLEEIMEKVQTVVVEMLVDKVPPLLAPTELLTPVVAVVLVDKMVVLQVPVDLVLLWLEFVHK